MLDLSLSKPSEVVKKLCKRLRLERLTLKMTQADVADITAQEADEMILRLYHVARQFSDIANELYPNNITSTTLKLIQSRIDDNIQFLECS